MMRRENGRVLIEISEDESVTNGEVFRGGVMTHDEITQRVRELTTAHQAALQELVEPARAAANAMKDAHLDRSADPLLEALFKLDALTAEMREFVNGNITEVVDAFINSMIKKHKGEH
jgi:hypothetical protein